MKVELSRVNLAALEERLAAFERRFGVPSERMADAFMQGGRLVETEEFRSWSEVYATVRATRRLAHRS